MIFKEVSRWGSPRRGGTLVAQGSGPGIRASLLSLAPEGRNE
jgi:hypothetical protein